MRYVALTVLAYILFNISIIEAGNSIVNIALANFAGGLFTLYVRKGNLREASFIKAFGGILGIPMIVYGLSYAHLLLKAPADVMEVVYDIFVVSFTLVLWSQGKAKKLSIDLPRHAIMLGLVASRLAIHWQPHWNWKTFIPVGVAVLGYIAFNASIKASAGHAGTNALMNIYGGITVLLVGLFIPGTKVAFTAISWVALLAAGSIVLIVWSLGKAYGHEGFKTCAEVIPALVYDGLLLFAPLTIGLIYAQPLGWIDMLITLGFLLVTWDRYLMHKYDLNFWDKISEWMEI